LLDNICSILYTVHFCIIVLLLFSTKYFKLNLCTH